MERMIKYFDSVKADEELKTKTKSFVMSRIAAAGTAVPGALTESRYPEKVKKPAYRRLSFAILPVAAFAVLFIGVYAFYSMPVDYISLDVNPSVELGLNRLGNVAEAEGYNEDGISVLSKVEVKHMPAEEAVRELTLEANREGYIKADGSTVIAVTALSGQAGKASQLTDQIGGTLRTMIQNGELNAVVYTDRADLPLREEARKAGLSPGKYKLIQLLQSLDPGVGTEQYRNASITDILVEAAAMLPADGTAESGSGRYAWDYGAVMKAAIQVREAGGDEVRQPMEQEQNQNRNENQPQDKNQNNSPIDPIGQPQEQNQSQSQGTSSPAIEQGQPENQDQNQSPNQYQDDSQTGQEQGQTLNQGAGSSDAGQDPDQGSSQSSHQQGGQGSGKPR